MDKLLRIVGYDKMIGTKDRMAYLIGLISILLMFSYLPVYTFYYKFFLGALVCIVAIGSISFGCLLMYRQNLLWGKSVIILSIILQISVFAIHFMPNQADVNIYLIGIAPASFSIYYLDNKRERIISILISAIALFLTFSTLFFSFEPLMQLNESDVHFFSISSYVLTGLVISGMFFKFNSDMGQYQQSLNTLACTDALTGCKNRRVFFQDGHKLFARAHKDQGTFALLIMDLDHFKNVNDTYGHPTGDEVLRSIIDYMGANIRSTDAIYRYGGEEFAILYKDLQPSHLGDVADELREGLSKHRIQLNEHVTLRITTSIGTIMYSKDFKSFDEMVRVADKALYEAKGKGRNCVVVA